MNKKILLTGGAGYIGTHIAIELINKKYDVVIVDNLSNSNKESVNRIPKITGKKPKLYIFDGQNARKLDEVFKENKIDSVVHLAGLKAVGGDSWVNSTEVGDT